MKPQIVHEAEIHRQYVRLRIPIAVEIDGTRYSVDDWSMGGFGVAGPITSRRDGERFAVRADLPVRGFRADAAPRRADDLHPARPAAVRGQVRGALAGADRPVPLRGRFLPLRRDRLGRRHPQRRRRRADGRGAGAEAVLCPQRGGQLRPPPTADRRHRADGIGRHRPHRADRRRPVPAAPGGQHRAGGDRSADLPAGSHRVGNRRGGQWRPAAAGRPRGTAGQRGQARRSRCRARASACWRSG